MIMEVLLWGYLICHVDTHKCTPSPTYKTYEDAKMDTHAIKYPYYATEPKPVLKQEK